MQRLLRSFAACAAIAGALHCPTAQPQTHVAGGTIRIIAPVPPGSPPDAVARLLADALGTAFGHPVVVENRPGGNQTIGLGAVASSNPDGRTLGMVSLPTAIVPSIMANMPYDPLHAFKAVREVAWTSNVLIVRSDSRWRSVDDIVAAAKANPGKMTFASGGNGTPAHVMAELFCQQAGIQALHVPFKGSVEGVTAVIAGHVDFMLASAGPVEPYVRAGKLNALAQTTRARLALLPRVPTFAEIGFPGIAARDWQGLVAPAGTPGPVVDELSRAISKALESPEFLKRLAIMGMEPVQDSDPRQFNEFLDSEMKRWAAIAKASGLQAQ